MPGTSPVLSVTSAIEARTSIRKYVQEPIPEADLNEILRLTSLAPSANNVQPWRFHVVTSPELKAKLQEAAYGQQQVTSAPAVILLVSDMEDAVANLLESLHPALPEERRVRDAENLAGMFNKMGVEGRDQWGVGQTYIALGFLLLAAQGLGYSTVPMLGFDPVKVREIMGLPEHAKIAAMVPVGRAAVEGFPKHRHSLDRIVTRY